MINLDVLFYDPVAYKYYDPSVLASQPLGGTEATVVRVAEELGRKGLKVGVMGQHTPDVIAGPNAYYFPMSYTDKVSPENVVSVRGVSAFKHFPKARRNYSWLHDMPDSRIHTMQPLMIASDAIVVAVSDFHKTELQRLTFDDDWRKVPVVKRIYNPVDEQIGKIPAKTKIVYDKNVMVWAASAHKGLAEALPLFQRLREFIPTMELRIFSPGYLEYNIHRQPGVKYYGPVPCKELWQHMSEALCTFYPTTFRETFGLIAAESNAVHTPIATMGIGGLNESVQTPNQLVSEHDNAGLLKKIESWYNGNRPEVSVQPRFRISQVGDEWIKLMYGMKSLLS